MKRMYIVSKIMLTAMVISMMVSSCHKTENSESSAGRNYSDYEKRMVSQLTGTSWRYDKYVRVYSSEKEEIVYTTGILTFSDDEIFHMRDLGRQSENMRYTADGSWYFKDDKLYMTFIAPPGVSWTASEKGNLIAIIGIGNTITSVTPTSMVWHDYGIIDDVRYFTKVNYTEGGGNTGGGGNSSNGDAPYVTSFDFTATKSSITVKFMCSERPNSATVKYGTSSANTTVSSSIIGKQVSATATGLKAGTKYYFKCTVKNEYGSSTSDEFYAITNY